MPTHTYSDGDILVIVENISFKIHKKILSLASDVFKDMISHNIYSCEEKIPRLEIEQENAQEFNNLLSFIYPQKHVTITWNNVESLLRISDKFMVESATTACEKFLENNFRRDPMLSFFLADTYNFKSLYKESSKLILNSYQKFISEPSFERLSERARSSLNERYIKFFFGLSSIVNSTILDDYIHRCNNASHHDVLNDEWKKRVKDLTLFPPSPSTIYKKIFFQINGNYNRKCNDRFTNKYLPEKIGDLLGDFEALDDTISAIHNQKYYIFIEK
ncbi:hypothetical protein RclHR1_05820013 [Rhizophagus clarus]|uniref:BTB domain-containing protein n=1 Tax=Rhizophagus clarus TaxID=94130 RepID=A0A2Z6RQZ9_9GLOM|nr:hypothetical protein RclHR1_05820013 [Rhizophagus clarus]